MPKRLLANDFFRHGLLVFAATMVTNVINYAFNFVLSRKLGVENYATLTSLIGGFMILSIPAAAINLIAVKYAADYHHAGDAARLRRLATQLLKVTSVIALALLALGFIFRGGVAQFLHLTDPTPVVPAFVVAALGIVFPCTRGILQGCEDFVGLSISTILESALKLALGIAFVFAGSGVTGALLGWVVGSAIAFTYTLFAVNNDLRHEGEPHRLRLEPRQLAFTIGAVSGSTALLTLLTFMDVVLVKHYFSARDAGLYAAVNLSGKIVFFFVSFLPAVLLPKVVARVKRGENPAGLLLQAVGVTAVASLAVIGAFALNPHFAIGVLAGGAFVAAAPYVVQYGIAMALLAVLTLVVNFRVALHRFEFLYGLSAVFVGEVVAVAFRHQTLWDVVHILIAGNCLAIVTSTFDLGFSRAPGRLADDAAR